MSEPMMIFVDRLGESPKYYASNQYGFVGASTTSVRVWGKKHDLTADVERLLGEARADEARRCAADVCWACNPNNSWKFGEAARMGVNWWQHQNDRGDIQACLAGTIHERLHRESQKGGNHEKTETQTGADYDANCDDSQCGPEVVKSVDFDAGEVKCIDKGAG